MNIQNQIENDTEFSWINPVNVVEVAKALLELKNCQDKLNNPLEKLNKALYYYRFRLTRETNYLSKIDSLEQDLITLIIQVKEIIPLLTSENKKNLEIFAANVLQRKLKNTSIEDMTIDISISWERQE